MVFRIGTKALLDGELCHEAGLSAPGSAAPRSSPPEPSVAAGRPQDLADAAALGEATQHTQGDAQQPGDPAELRRKAREEWLELRDAEGSALTPEAAREKGRQDWLKLREQQSGRTPDAGEETKRRDRNRGPGADDLSPGRSTDDDLE